MDFFGSGEVTVGEAEVVAQAALQALDVGHGPAGVGASVVAIDDQRLGGIEVTLIMVFPADGLG